MIYKILVADDSPSMCALIQSFLAPLKAEIQLAHSGEQCIEIASHWSPNLITMDIQMKGIGGLEACSLLKKLPNTSLIPIIVLSSIEDEITKTKAFEAGAIEYLVKPFTPEFLQARVSSILDLPDAKPAHQKVLIAEDTRAIMAIYKFLLPQIGCELIPCEDGQVAWDTLQRTYQEVDLIVSDINMPNMNGIEFVHKVRADHRFSQIPIIMSTTVSEVEKIKMLLNAGVNDYITKPFSHEEFTARVSSHLRTRTLMKEQDRLNLELKRFNEELEEKVKQRTREIKESQIDTIFMLALASDAKDSDTANHIHRVRYYSQAIARKMGCDDAQAEAIGYSSMMHDVGKIAIPDSILRKPGKLTEEEFAIMRTHTIAGAKILGDKPFFKPARNIANYHHERWDGTGYPEGLKSEKIPFEARIVTVADVYDALCSRRVYKPAWSEEEVLAELKKNSGSHLDPNVVKNFIELVSNGTIAQIRSQFPN